MKRLVMYLVPLMMMVMLFLAVPGELRADVYPDLLPWGEHPILPWYETIKVCEIPYFIDTATSDPVDLLFEGAVRNSSDGTLRGTLVTQIARTWVADPWRDELIDSFTEESAEDSYQQLTWDSAATTGYGQFDLLVSLAP
ncbi:MAG TPA: hypothetical protein ENH10_05610 [Bacteroidetes bacterium]|nr:hypothetical protein BMS3Bbin04_01684 [bacterium BMS3Bbin04]HDO65496.1 hypothetical protein [Bacteroidota bacterium]HEX04621.1 hypothetical protein [Bacteroidota bacterium]